MGRGRKYGFGPTRIAFELYNIIKRSPWGFERVARLAGVGSRISAWSANTHPRLDIFIDVADAMGYDVVLVRREREPYNSADEPTIPGLLND